jgi:putative endonuclease
MEQRSVSQAERRRFDPDLPLQILQLLMYFVYIIHSPALAKYYVGYSQNADERLLQHRSSRHGWSSRASDWVEVMRWALATEGEARRLESKIKRRGAARFLVEMNVIPRGAG